MDDKWDLMYMNMAQVAADESHAVKRKVGAIAVRNDNIIGVGINGTPKGWYSNVCEDDKGKTLPHVLHAEGNLVAKIAKAGESSDGAVLYCTTAPCIDCAKQIASAGFRRVVYKEKYKSWQGIDFLRMAGVEVSALK
jgi:dCMP deaminase